MPKRMVSGPAEAGGGPGGAALPLWQATGLSLAAIVGDAYTGSGALVFVPISACVIWALHRLHAHAPLSRSTADLIASAPGAVPARPVSVIQFVAYVLMAAFIAKGIGVLALSWSADPVAAVNGWWWPVLSVAAVAVAAAVVGALPTRLLAPVVTVLAAFGLLVLFYVALAVVARVATGTAPIEIGPPAASFGWGPAALVIGLAVSLVGFEIPTAASDRLRSVSRPLGWAIAIVAGCAATSWVAVNMGAAGDFRYDAAELLLIAGEMFGEAGSLWLLAGLIATAAAALLVLVWGATRVVHRQVGRGGTGLAVTAVLVGVLTVAMCLGWGDASAKLLGVAGILLVIVYALAAHASSRLDDDNTTAWAVFAFMGVALVVVVFVLGADGGWWPVLIAGVIVAIAAASAFSRETRRA